MIYNVNCVTFFLFAYILLAPGRNLHSEAERKRQFRAIRKNQYSLNACWEHNLTGTVCQGTLRSKTLTRSSNQILGLLSGQRTIPPLDISD